MTVLLYIKIEIFTDIIVFIYWMDIIIAVNHNLYYWYFRLEHCLRNNDIIDDRYVNRDEDDKEDDKEDDEQQRQMESFGVYDQSEDEPFQYVRIIDKFDNVIEENQIDTLIINATSIVVHSYDATTFVRNYNRSEHYKIKIKKIIELLKQNTVATTMYYITSIYGIIIPKSTRHLIVSTCCSFRQIEYPEHVLDEILILQKDKMRPSRFEQLMSIPTNKLILNVPIHRDYDISINIFLSEIILMNMSPGNIKVPYGCQITKQKSITDYNYVDIILAK